MFHTFLIDTWGFRYPTIGASVAGFADGVLTAVVPCAGELGMIGAGSQIRPALCAIKPPDSYR